MATSTSIEPTREPTHNETSETGAKVHNVPYLKQGMRGSRLEPLDWSAGLSAIAYGVRVGIRTNSAELLEIAATYLPIGWKLSISPLVDRLYSLRTIGSEAGERALIELYRDDQRLIASSDKQEVLERLESDASLYVAEVNPRRVFVHSGVVAWAGSAILIPGRSHAGKTTLTAALVRAGATYYSDEFAVLDQRGMVHPYARPLQLRDRPGARQVRCSVERLGGTAGHVPLPVGLILLAHFKLGAKWRPRHLSPGQALLGILSNTVSARRAPEAAMRALKPVVSSSFAVKGARGEVEEVIDWVLAHFHPHPIPVPAGN